MPKELTIRVNPEELGQAIKNANFMLQKLEDILDMAILKETMRIRMEAESILKK